MLTRRAMLQAGALAALAGCRLARARAHDHGAELDKRLVVRLDQPYCGEARLEHLVERWVTDPADFFVLNHADAPAIDAGAWSLEVTGLVRRPLRVTLDELRARPATTVPATLMCAGNRRREHDLRRPLGGGAVMWGPGAIGNAWWTGVPLADLLADAGLLPGAGHVELVGLDAGHHGAFGGSIPLARVLDRDTPPVVLAHAMNDRPLPRLHGYPLRAVVPGFIGARSVKWLGRVVVSAAPSANPYFARDHRWPSRTAIYALPVNAAACAVIRDGERAEVHGYAIAGAPTATVRAVEVSTDGGRSWQPAALDDAAAPSCWRRWSVEVAADARVRVRATDSDGRVQPRVPPWNPGGYLYNGWPDVALAAA